MDNDNSRNTIIFFVSFVVIMVVYQVLVLGPQARKHQAEVQKAAAAQHQPGAVAPVAVGVLPTPQAVTASPQVAIDTPSLTGRITLRGARIDELFLKGYHTTTDPKSPLVQLLRPEGAPHAWFIQTGWTNAAAQDLPDLDADADFAADAKL
jgi:YidC/Oxa1 family membrane protein insertase